MENHLLSYNIICTKVNIKDQGQDWVKVIDKSQNSHFLIFSVLRTYNFFFRKHSLLQCYIFFPQIIKDCMNVFYTKYMCVMIVFWNPWHSNMYLLHSGWLLILPFREWDSSFLLVWICCYLTIIRFYRK